MELLEEDGFQASKLRPMSFSWQPFLHDLPWRPLGRLPRSQRLQGCHLALRQLGELQVYEVLEVAQAPVAPPAVEQRLLGLSTASASDARAAEECLQRLKRCRTLLCEGATSAGFLQALAERRRGAREWGKASFQAFWPRDRP